MNLDHTHPSPLNRSGSTGLTDHHDRSGTPKMTQTNLVPHSTIHTTQSSTPSQHGSTPIISHRTKIILNTPNNSTPCSPSSSSGHNSITIAEKRQTQVSKYLISNDFKSSFATKLNDLRKRESDLTPPAYLSAPAATNPSHLPHPPPPIDHTPSDSILLTNSTSPVELLDQKLIQELPEPPEDQLPSTSIDKIIIDPGSCPLEITSYEDPEQQNAKYEVIGKLADQLADQIEENDHLLYELGVVRSNHARLQAYTTDKEDEVACLNYRIRQLESVITTPSSSSTTHDPQACDKQRFESEASIRSLNVQAQQLRRAVCRLQLELYKLRKSHRVIPNAPSHLDRFSPSDHNETRAAVRPASMKPPLLDVRRSSWSGVPTQSTWRHSKQALNQSTWPIFNRQSQSSGTSLDHNRLGSDDPSHIRYERITDPDELGSLKAQVEQLRAELSDCQEARMTSEITLQALIESISNDPDLHRSLSRAPSGSQQRSDLTRVRNNEIVVGRKTTTGLGIISSTITERKALSELSLNLEIMNQNATNEESPVIVSAVPAEQHSNSPLISLTNFGFIGWGRKQDSSRSSTMKTGVVSSGEPRRASPPRMMSESRIKSPVDQEQQHILPPTPTTDREGASTSKTLAQGSLFNSPRPSATSSIESRHPAFSSSPASSPNPLQRPATGRSSQDRSTTTSPMTMGQLVVDHPLENGLEESSEKPQGLRGREEELDSIDSIHDSGSADLSMTSSNLFQSELVDPADSGLPNPEANLDKLKQSVFLDPNPLPLSGAVVADLNQIVV